MTWFYLNLLSITALALAELTQQNLLNKKQSIPERTSGALTFFSQALYSLPLIIVMGKIPEIFELLTSKLLWPLLIVSGLAAVAMIFYLKSFRVKNISFSSILVSSSSIVSTVLGIILFNESVSLRKFMGLLLIFLAIVLVNINNQHIEKNHLYGLLAGLFFGLCYVIDKALLAFIDPLVYIFLGFALVSLFSFLFAPKEVMNFIKKAKYEDYKPILISAIGYFIYNLFTFVSYTLGGEVGKVDAINNSQIFLLIAFEYIFLKHRKGIKRKLVCALLAFTGVMLLGLFK